ncbi:LacI family DNA-binding transcriptional regulator [Paenisporosarcina antarctica]|uniref:LacI family transcriptional regulator n=1 Tax=Paenisporosarcina antarctica TaxID=417367 RepID=A0A4P7A3N7_9BACL|nr:LacI family DNA-binding transcriptional regulator [Paenisporosarcina antarctica]QBP42656.1 LacI family transcriptional regulator [Paenisporosarcina antarctica]
MANMREIAKEAGVGISTVSRYINNTGYVSERSRAKIERVIEKSHYKPNELARAIFTRNSKIIGLLVPNISNPYFNELALIIEEYASEQGFSIFLCNTNDDFEKESNYINVLQGHRVAGIITVRSQCKNEYAAYDIPVVSFESYISEKIITVATDNFTGGSLAFNHLYECGCRNLVHVAGPLFADAISERTRGFIESAREKNITVDLIQFETDFQRKMLEANIKTLEDIEKYDGIFVFNDIAAATVIRYFQQKNVRIPEEVQVIGFDNSYIGEFLFPSLTTIEQSVQEVGRTLVEALLKLIKGEAVDQKKIIIKPNLVKRDSTRVSK